MGEGGRDFFGLWVWLEFLWVFALALGTLPSWGPLSIFLIQVDELSSDLKILISFGPWGFCDLFAGSHR